MAMIEPHTITCIPYVYPHTLAPLIQARNRPWRRLCHQQTTWSTCCSFLPLHSVRASDILDLQCQVCTPPGIKYWFYKTCTALHFPPLHQFFVWSLNSYKCRATTYPLPPFKSCPCHSYPTMYTQGRAETKRRTVAKVSMTWFVHALVSIRVYHRPQLTTCSVRRDMKVLPLRVERPCHLVSLGRGNA